MTGYEPGPLRFRYWPFDLVPRPGARLVWADRANLRIQIERLGRRLGRHEAVSLHLLWADFGAGKSHTLLFLKQEAEDGRYGPILPLYSALPKGCRGFIDVYRAIVRGIPGSLLRDAYERGVVTLGRVEVERRLTETWPNLARCFQAIAIGSEAHQRTALGWLHAEGSVPTAELQGLSILGRVRSTDDAVLALCGVVELFNLAGYRRTMFMVDEFQRVATLRRQQQDDVNAGLHGFFNGAPHGMSLLLSFSFGDEKNIRHFLNAELLSRADPLRISIGALTGEEGRAFLDDVINQARETSSDWPVAADVVSEIVASVPDRLKLTPRRLIKAAGLVFDSAANGFEDGSLIELTAQYVRDMVAAGEFSRIDEDERED